MSYKVLFVDDEPNIILALRRALRKEPYEILSACSAKEALTFLSQTPVDVVVSDENMPCMKGTDFLTIVSREYSDTIRIILTGHADLQTAIRAINEGKIYRFLTKPCNEVELAIIIREALRQKELLLKSRQLLNVVKSQSVLIDQLEVKHPGITHVARDDKGSVIIDDSPHSYNELMQELGIELKKAEQRFNQPRK